MSFMSLLEDARKQSKTISVPEDTHVKTISETNSNNIVEDKIKTEANIELTIGDAIIKTSENALKCKLKGSGAAIRLAKAISVKKHITSTQLDKMFYLQRRHKEAHINYMLVGGHPLSVLKNLLENGVSLKDALNSNYKG